MECAKSVVIKYNFKKLCAELHGMKTPCIVYDREHIVHNISEFLQGCLLNTYELFFAEKANRNIKVLTLLNEIGIGIDVASMEELAMAQTVGFKKISATSPAFINEELQNLFACEAEVDFDNISQLKKYFADRNNKSNEIGVRVRVPFKFDGDTTFGNNSRFGIDVLSPEFRECMSKYGLKIRRLHIHIGEYRTIENVDKVIDYIKRVLSEHQMISSINFGGGYTYLFANKSNRNLFWQKISDFDRKIIYNYKIQMKYRFEPGMQLLLNAGYLVTKVLHINQNDKSKAVVVDGSAWCLYSWQPIRIIGKYPSRPTLKSMYSIYGNSCYEGDVFIKKIELSELQENDYIVWGYAGAYMSSMMRNMHGFYVEEYVI